MCQAKLTELVEALFYGWDCGPWPSVARKLNSVLSQMGFCQRDIDWVLEMAEGVVDFADRQQEHTEELVLQTGIDAVVAVLTKGPPRSLGTEYVEREIKAVLALDKL